MKRHKTSVYIQRIAKTVMMLNYAHIQFAFKMGNGSSLSMFFRSLGDGGRGAGGGDGGAALDVLVFLHKKFK